MKKIDVCQSFVMIKVKSTSLIDTFLFLSANWQRGGSVKIIQITWLSTCNDPSGNSTLIEC